MERMRVSANFPNSKNKVTTKVNDDLRDFLRPEESPTPVVKKVKQRTKTTSQHTELVPLVLRGHTIVGKSITNSISRRSRKTVEVSLKIDTKKDTEVGIEQQDLSATYTMHGGQSSGHTPLAIQNRIRRNLSKDKNLLDQMLNSTLRINSKRMQLPETYSPTQPRINQFSESQKTLDYPQSAVRL